MALTLQHGLSPVIRRRAPLDDSVTAAIEGGLEQGDWLKVISASGLYGVPNDYGSTDASDRVAFPIIIEPSQPDASVAGMAVAFGYHSGQTDRYAPSAGANLFDGYVAGDTPTAPVAGVTYVAGGALFVAGFSAAATAGSALGTLVYGLAPVDSTDAAQVAATVAYVERLPADNNGLLQYVVF